MDVVEAATGIVETLSLQQTLLLLLLKPNSLDVCLKCKTVPTTFFFLKAIVPTTYKLSNHFELNNMDLDVKWDIFSHSVALDFT